MMTCRTRRYPGYTDSSGVSLNRGYELATPADCVRACVCVSDRLTIRLLPLLTLFPPWMAYYSYPGWTRADSWAPRGASDFRCKTFANCSACAAAGARAQPWLCLATMFCVN